MTAIKVMNGSEVLLVTEGNLNEMNYRVWIHSRAQDKTVWHGDVERSLKIELPPGTYYLYVFTRLTRGDTSNIFRIEVNSFK